MKAILLKEFGGVENLYIADTQTPKPKPDELLIKVKATALNRADIAQRKGLYPPPPGESEILGLDMSGVVEDMGTGCTSWKKGDRVFGLLAGGGYAEYALIQKDMAMQMPENMSFEEAAAIPEVFLTAYLALIWLGRLKSEEFILIHAGASGVGTAAIQIAREVGAHPVITAGSEQKLKACLELGATAAINYRQGSFKSAVMTATNQKGISLIIDFIGAPYWEQNIDVMKTDGRLVFLSLLGGSKINHLDLKVFMKKRLKVVGSTLRNRSPEYKIKLTREFKNFALPRFSDERLKPVIDRIFPWVDVAEAHQYMEDNRNIGKILLKLPD